MNVARAIGLRRAAPPSAGQGRAGAPCCGLNL